MTGSYILQMLKANLEIVNNIHDTYLSQLIQAAEREITREGIVIKVEDGEYDIDDAHLIVMYAAYLYRKRSVGMNGQEYISNGILYPQGIPYMLRLTLNNRLFSQKMRTTEA